MHLNAPKQVTWLVALILAVLAFIGALFTIPVLTQYGVWIALVSAVLLLLATWFEGL